MTMSSTVVRKLIRMVGLIVAAIIAVSLPLVAGAISYFSLQHSVESKAQVYARQFSAALELLEGGAAVLPKTDLQRLAPLLVDDVAFVRVYDGEGRMRLKQAPTPVQATMARATSPPPRIGPIR
jgi:uncharacterized membrane protein (DUF441 family)